MDEKERNASPEEHLISQKSEGDLLQRPEEISPEDMKEYLDDLFLDSLFGKG